jgi:dihydropyrimidine dehydrogenase (NAD+) subunit PreA
MAHKADLSIEYLGVKCENPFFLSSSPVAGSYDMVKKAYEAGWGGVFFQNRRHFHCRRMLTPV